MTGNNCFILDEMTNTEKIPFSYSFGNSCRNFAANIFDQTKCKNCMKPREEHLGIEDAKVKARPVHYGWLLMAPPGWTPIAGSAMGSRRWQRRFFVLYELGTLNWSLDDEAGTDPAGVLDLNKPYAVAKADEETQLTNTICISSLNENQNEKTIIRAETREECIFWYRSLAKMIDDSKERQKQSARRNKMLVSTCPGNSGHGSFGHIMDHFLAQVTRSISELNFTIRNLYIRS